MKQLLPLVLLSLTCCGTSHLGRPVTPPPAEVSVPGITVKKDVVFTPADWPQALVADIYLPSGPGPWPGVLLVHGGGWREPERRSDMAGIARRLARRGYVVMNTTYRLVPDHRYPAPVEDLRQAHSWMQRHAGSLHLRGDRIAIFGYSAGGHLAALLGGLDAAPSRRFQAVVAGGAPSDMRKFVGEGMASEFLDGTSDQVPAIFAEASPITHVTRDDPPVFLYHGGKDTTVPPDHAVDYQAALTRAGIPNELFWLKGRGHVAAFLSDRAAVAAAIQFLDRHLR